VSWVNNAAAKLPVNRSLRALLMRTRVSELPWGHNRLLLTKLDNPARVHKVCNVLASHEV